ncbi:hypothetical protein KIPB_004416 [Kipferlia bialata]|uniref:BRCT domain-containing protein n=1 Tax=Kipferlia bialata TaxID=797122 RepID=A0A9K3GGK1_9EUKA|nr:hypothetical protein KIPB_004416 [Kipferlia bialata]|eukprot:g4416.t1
MGTSDEAPSNFFTGNVFYIAPSLSTAPYLRKVVTSLGGSLSEQIQGSNYAVLISLSPPDVANVQIITPAALMTQATACTIGSDPNDVFQAMSGLVVCTTSINDHASVHSVMKGAGAQVTLNLWRACTHLVCGKTGSQKYQYAVSRRIPCVTENWVHACIQEGMPVPVAPYLLDGSKPPFNPLFYVSPATSLSSEDNEATLERDVLGACSTMLRSFSPLADFCVCSDMQDPALHLLKDTAEPVSRVFLLDSATAGGVLPREDFVLYRPLPKKGRSKDMQDVVVCTSGLDDTERENTSMMVLAMGANFSTDLSPRNTHLVVPENWVRGEPETNGEYQYTNKIKAILGEERKPAYQHIKVVSMAYLEACVAAWGRLDETPYLMTELVGPPIDTHVEVPVGVVPLADPKGVAEQGVSEQMRAAFDEPSLMGEGEGVNASDAPEPVSVTVSVSALQTGSQYVGSPGRPCKPVPRVPVAPAEPLSQSEGVEETMLMETREEETRDTGDVDMEGEKETEVPIERDTEPPVVEAPEVVESVAVPPVVPEVEVEAEEKDVDEAVREGEGEGEGDVDMGETDAVGPIVPVCSPPEAEEEVEEEVEDEVEQEVEREVEEEGKEGEKAEEEAVAMEAVAEAESSVPEPVEAEPVASPAAKRAAVEEEESVTEVEVEVETPAIAKAVSPPPSPTPPPPPSRPAMSAVMLSGWDQEDREALEETLDILGVPVIEPDFGGASTVYPPEHVSGCLLLPPSSRIPRTAKLMYALCLGWPLVTLAPKDRGDTLGAKLEAAYAAEGNSVGRCVPPCPRPWALSCRQAGVTGEPLLPYDRVVLCGKVKSGPIAAHLLCAAARLPSVTVSAPRNVVGTVLSKNTLVIGSPATRNKLSIPCLFCAPTQAFDIVCGNAQPEQVLWD